MNCDIIKDLIPLYIDGVCSDESRYTVETHLTKCEDCKALYEAMATPIETEKAVKTVKKTHKIHLWKASILQSILFFASFLAITIGVYFEAQSGVNDNNGDWAAALVVPATGFLISLVNWYFVRLYKSRLSFSLFNALFTLGGISLCGGWAMWHYTGFPQFAIVGPFFTNVFVTVGLTVGSYLLSQLYARLLGKE